MTQEGVFLLFFKKKSVFQCWFCSDLKSGNILKLLDSGGYKFKEGLVLWP